MPGAAPRPPPEAEASLSVIVPVHGHAPELAECLAALQGTAPPGTELIVVDDASPDDAAGVAERLGTRVLRLARNVGPAGARNAGARAARGNLLVFVDADVVVAPGALARVVRTFSSRPELAAVFGSYDDEPRARGLVSQYRNLLHHFVHQTGDADASTFWAGCGAIRRAAFEAVGGFDAERFPRPSIEDIELGARLRRAGYRILLDKDLLATHLKRWTLGGVIRTDVLARALPWSRLILESRDAPHDLNLRRGQRLAVGLVAVAGLALLLAPFRPEALGVVAAAALAVVWLNRGLFLFLARRRGLAFAAACVPLHFLYHLDSGIGFLGAWLGLGARRAARRVDGAARSRD
jgi:hypothetical protein